MMLRRRDDGDGGLQLASGNDDLTLANLTAAEPATRVGPMGPQDPATMTVSPLARTVPATTSLNWTGSARGAAGQACARSASTFAIRSAVQPQRRWLRHTHENRHVRGQQLHRTIGASAMRRWWRLSTVWASAASSPRSASASSSSVCPGASRASSAATMGAGR